MTPALFALAMLAPGGAAAASTAAGSLTPELEGLSAPALAEASPEEQAEAIGLPVEGPGSLSREGERVVVEAHFEEGALGRLEALEEAGAKILVASREYQTVALSVEPEDLEALAEVPGVDLVAAARRPQIYATEGAATTLGTGSTICEGGSVIGQGVGQLRVEAAREDFGARGRGVTVGVLSDSFNSATKSESPNLPLATKAKEDELSDDLPGPNNGCSGQGVAVRVLAEGKASPNEELHDEGRAMLQVIHDVAPHAQLAFATAYGSELEFARNIERLAEPVLDGGAGANVIVDDVAYFNEPYFQEGPVANAIRRVTEAGVTYLTAAANNNLFESEVKNGKTVLLNHEIGSWERAEYDDALCQGVVAKQLAEKGYFSSEARCLNFSPTGTDSPSFGIKVKGKAKLLIDMQWAEPWYGVESDLDAYLVDASEKNVLAPVSPLRPFNNIGEGGEEGGKKFSAPVEVLEWTNPSESTVEVKLVVDRCAGFCNPSANPETVPRVKIGILENGSGGVEATEYHESMPSKGITMGPTVFGHAGSSSAITVGAVNFAESRTEPRRPENYSSRGPFTAYFKPVAGTTPASPLAQPEVISKPDITATDCASTTFFSWFNTTTAAWEFCGTSESAPHAAAVAALMKQADSLASPKAIREAMAASATPFKTIAFPYAVGAGLLNADKALTVLTAPNGIKLEDPPSELISGGGGGGGGTPEEGKGGSGTENEKEKEPPTPTPPTPTPLPAPVVSVTKGPASVDNEARPTFEFTASQKVSFTCQIDGAAPQPCSSPYVSPAALGDGQHGFAVTGTDSEGRSGSSNTYYFTVDTKAPKARIVSHPAKLVKTAKPTYVARFRLTADQSPVTFYCQMDKGPQKICGDRLNARVKPGAHVLKVKAKDALGNMSAASTFSFKVKKLGRAGSSARSARR